MFQSLNLSTTASCIKTSELNPRIFWEYHCIWWSSILEMTDLISFLHNLSDFNCCHTARYLSHPYINQSNFANKMIACINHYHFPCSDCTMERFIFIQRFFIRWNTVGLINIIGSWDIVHILDDTVGWSIPSMMKEGI